MKKFFSLAAVLAVTVLFSSSAFAVNLTKSPQLPISAVQVKFLSALT